MALNRKQKIGLSILGLLLLINIIFLLFFYKNIREERLISTIKINKQIIKAEIVSNALDQYSGLSNRPSLCADCGMLFVFPDKQDREFVMRNMNFPLDIIFLDNGKIINIAANLRPEGNNPITRYKSLTPANQVLELNGGYSEKHDIKAGDMVIYNN